MAHHLKPVLEQEMRVLDQPETVRLFFDGQHTDLCGRLNENVYIAHLTMLPLDICYGTIFFGFYFCRICGFLTCISCFEQSGNLSSMPLVLRLPIYTQPGRLMVANTNLKRLVGAQGRSFLTLSKL